VPASSPAPLPSRREEAANSLVHGLGAVLAAAGLAVLAVAASRRGTAAAIACA
jgi:predicted membrane channel-forming protein YqfA (hemolysin III family)